MNREEGEHEGSFVVSILIAVINSLFVPPMTNLEQVIAFMDFRKALVTDCEHGDKKNSCETSEVNLP